jgi:uncharacterized protein (UPF0333 family)
MMFKMQGTGQAQHEFSLMHRLCILCVICALICYIPDSCNREPYLTVSICFRRINHIAVKNNLHSSSGARGVVSGRVSFCIFEFAGTGPVRCFE